MRDLLHYDHDYGSEETNDNSLSDDDNEPDNILFDYSDTSTSSECVYSEDDDVDFRIAGTATNLPLNGDRESTYISKSGEIDP